MEELNIPLYRARKIDSDEYIIFKSFYVKDACFYAITKIINVTAPDGWVSSVHLPLTQKIDATTLAIHFPNNLDSQGNKIFASLREDGKGGDITLTKDGKALYERVHLCFKDGGLGGMDLNIVQMLSKKYNGVLDIKVIGIKE